MTRTAIVILNYNGENLLPRFLPSVLLHSEAARIVVVDNGSTDKSVTLIRQNFPQVTLIELDKNYGFCGGYNRALRQVEALYYVLLNSDVEVTSGWLTPLIDLLVKDHTIAAIQPKILSHSDKTKFEYAGAGGGYIDSFGYPFCRGRLFDHLETDHGQYNDQKEIFWATGACMMIRSSVYHTFNGMDEDFFAHMEEIDLCWKIQRTDYRILYCGESKVYHLGAGTLGYNNPGKTHLNFRNGLILLFKHLDTGEMLFKIPMRMVLDWVAAVRFLLIGEGNNFLAVFKAHIGFIGGLRRHYRKRKNLRKDFPWYSRKNIYRGLILFNFFIRKKSVVVINNPR